MKRKISLLLTVTSALLAVGGTVLRTRMLRTAYSAADGFYLDDFWHGVLYGVLLAFVISAFAAAHIYIKEGKIKP